MSRVTGLARYLPLLGLALAACTYLVTSFDYSPESRAIPRAVALLALALIALHAVSQEMRRPRTMADGSTATGEGATPRTDGETFPAAAPSFRSEATAFAWIAALLILVVVAGFYVAVPVFIFGYLLVHARKSVLTAGAFAIGVTGLLFLLFDLLMGYALFGGLIAGDFL